jgi:hypothetical protein
LIAENHYDVIGEELKKRGMKRYTESHENKRIYLADGMDVKKNADIPMSAMWTPGSLAGGSDEEPRSEADIRESASVANIYGKPIVAAESMTSVGNAFSFHPEKLKRTADLELASGLNRFVIHTSVHQPWMTKNQGFLLDHSDNILLVTKLGQSKVEGLDGIFGKKLLFITARKKYSRYLVFLW